MITDSNTRPAAALLAFFGLVLGAGAAAFGGRSDTPGALRGDVAVAR